jgi:hypothetical protein
MRRTVRPRVRVDALPTTELLRLHERAFGPLDPAGKARMLETARQHGWDRAFDERLAA